MFELFPGSVFPVELGMTALWAWRDMSGLAEVQCLAAIVAKQRADAGNFTGVIFAGQTGTFLQRY